MKLPNKSGAPYVIPRYLRLFSTRLSSGWASGCSCQLVEKRSEDEPKIFLS